MSAHRFYSDWAKAAAGIPDPGDGKALPNGATGIVNIITGASGETNTLAAPATDGLLLGLNLLTDGGGDRVITVAAAYDDSGSTSITLGTAGQLVLLYSYQYGTTYRWREIKSATDLEAQLAAVTAGNGAAKVGLIDAGAFTTAATVEAAIAELYQHLFSVQGGCVPIAIQTLVEVDSNGDVGAIAVASGNGGKLASDTTPILKGEATTEAICLEWASSNSDIVAGAVGLPPDMDDTADAFIDLFVKSAGTANDVAFTVLTTWDNGTQVSDAAAAAGGTFTDYHTITATVAAADIPATPRALSFQLVPGAHTTDAWTLYGARLRYKRKLLAA
jgi:hypothetical protein